MITDYGKELLLAVTAQWDTITLYDTGGLVATLASTPSVSATEVVHTADWTNASGSPVTVTELRLNDAADDCKIDELAEPVVVPAGRTARVTVTITYAEVAP